MDLRLIIFLVIMITVIDIFIGHKIENGKKPKEIRDSCIRDILQEKLPNLSEESKLSKHNRTGIFKGILSLDDFLAIALFLYYFW